METEGDSQGEEWRGCEAEYPPEEEETVPCIPPSCVVSDGAFSYSSQVDEVELVLPFLVQVGHLDGRTEVLRARRT